MQHETLKDAINGKFNVLIPSSFVHVDDNTDRKIEVGTLSKDEVLQEGQSATQGPKEYTFQTASSTIHLLDTPGIGDVRGTTKDKENFDNILAFLLKYEKINAVCILMKPNNSRLTISFRFCVLELLTHLHKSLEQNLIFCFTHSRGTFYRPGDTLSVLKKLLNSHNIGLTLDNTRYFCFDNEAFRFLACLKNGVQFEDEEKEMFAQSWEKSLKTTQKLFQRVNNLPPHETKNTLSLNEARSIILALTKPMAEIIQVIDKNRKSAESVRKEIELTEGEISNFEKTLSFNGFDIERKNLDHPVTVCAHADCKKYVQVGQTQERNTVYPVICHDHCTIPGLPTETSNDNRLANCLAFDFRTHTAYEKFFGKSIQQFPGYKISKSGTAQGRDIQADCGFWTCDMKALRDSLSSTKKAEFDKYRKEDFQENCWGCGHSYKQHMHITYTTKVVEKEFFSKEVQNMIKGKKDEKAKKDAFVNELTNTINELENEKEYIMTCATSFGSFLKHNSMVPYNDAFNDYIDMLIQDEENKHESARNQRQITKLEEDKRIYQQKKEVLDKAMNTSKGTSIDVEDIFAMRTKMVNLKHNGKAIKDALDGILAVKQNQGRSRDSGKTSKTSKSVVSQFIKSIWKID